MKFTSKSLLKVLACTVVTMGAVSLAHAAANANVVGTWTWTGGGRGGGGGGGGRGMGGGTNTLVIKTQDASTGALVGTLASPMGGGRRGRGAPDAGGAPPPPPPAPTPVDIKNGKIAGNAISFEVTRPGRGGGPDMTIPYKGTVSDDGKTITGTITMPGRDGGEGMAMPFTATKQ